MSIDTAIDPQRRQHGADVRDAGPDQGAARARAVPVPRVQPLDRGRPQSLDDPGLLRGGRGGHEPHRGVRARRGRARGPARREHRPEPGRVPAALARGLPDDVDRLRRGRPQRAAHVGRVGAHGRPGRARGVRARPGAAQRVRAHRRRLPRDGRRAGGEAAGGRGAGPRSARPSTTSSPTACRSRCTSRPAEASMPIELAARTDAGGRLVATAERLSETLAANAPQHDRDGSFPFEAIDALKAARYFAAPVPVDIGRARRLLGARPGRGVEPPGARRRVRRDRREHAPDRGRQHGAPAPGRGGGRTGPPRARLRRIARADRPRRCRALRGDQRARTGPHPPGDGRHPHRLGLADRRPQAVLHDVAGRDRALRGGHLRATPRASSATPTRWSPPTRRVS